MGAKHISSLAFLTFLVLLAHLSVASCVIYASICNQTPHPELCDSLFKNSTPQATPDENLFYLRDISLRGTLARAENAHKHISQVDLSSFNELERAAWADCLELYQSTIHELNRSIGLRLDAFDDVQTWLSAAIANQQACQNGFLDFNLSSHLGSFSFMLTHDLSSFISNSLVINQAMHSHGTNQNRNRRLLAHGGDFPGWVSARDRRLLLLSDASTKADIVVARDGSGDYKTISEALRAAAKQRNGSSKRFVIHVKKGIYEENVEVKRSMRNLMFVGDGIDATIVTASKNVQDGFTTFRSATSGVSGDGFIARGVTFKNTAGPQKHQAVALRSSSDFSIFYSCSFEGYQDTLYVHSHRQFYRDCNIYGTIDFIFGDAVSIFQNCNIYLRKPMRHQQNTVTAQGRKDPNENTGIIIHNSIVTAAPDLRPVQSLYTSYLGRPWRKYSRTVFMKCQIDGVIDPAGWLPWSGNFALTTLYYGEYMNTGTGAFTGGRIKWPGFHVIRRAAEAGKFSVGSFYGGDSWILAAGVPFMSGL